MLLNPKRLVSHHYLLWYALEETEELTGPTTRGETQGEMRNCVKIGNVAKFRLSKTHRDCAFVFLQAGHRYKDILSLRLSLSHMPHKQTPLRIFSADVFLKSQLQRVWYSFYHKHQKHRDWKTYKKKHFCFKGRISLQLSGSLYHVCDSTIKEKSAMPTSLQRSTLRQLW